MSSFIYYHSPVGCLRIVEEQGVIGCVEFLNGETNATPTPLLTEATHQLDAYFTGNRQEFNLPLRPQGTPFQKRVWAALREIPYGETVSYDTLAQHLNTHPRAIGHANARNPIAIIIPCHRVICKNGDIGGYAGGIARKEALLKIEQKVW